MIQGAQKKEEPKSLMGKIGASNVFFPSPPSGSKIRSWGRKTHINRAWKLNRQFEIEHSCGGSRIEFVEPKKKIDCQFSQQISPSESAFTNINIKKNADVKVGLLTIENHSD